MTFKGLGARAAREVYTGPAALNNTHLQWLLLYSPPADRPPPAGVRHVYDALRSEGGESLAAARTALASLASATSHLLLLGFETHGATGQVSSLSRPLCECGVWSEVSGRGAYAVCHMRHARVASQDSLLSRHKTVV